MREETPLERRVRTALVVTLVLLGLAVTAEQLVTWRAQVADTVMRRTQLQMTTRRCRLGQRLEVQQRASGFLVAHCVVRAVQP